MLEKELKVLGVERAVKRITCTPHAHYNVVPWHGFLVSYSFLSWDGTVGTRTKQA